MYVQRTVCLCVFSYVYVINNVKANNRSCEQSNISYIDIRSLIQSPNLVSNSHSDLNESIEPTQRKSLRVISVR